MESIPVLIYNLILLSEGTTCSQDKRKNGENSAQE